MCYISGNLHVQCTCMFVARVHVHVHALQLPDVSAITYMHLSGLILLGFVWLSCSHTCTSLHVHLSIVFSPPQHMVLSCGLVVDVSVTGIKKTITLRSSMQVSRFAYD